ncbi:unnamed protein product, partial [Coregonus sp. 'balchen']
MARRSSVQALQKEDVELFSELMGTQGRIHNLEQELAQLRKKDQERSRLASMQDHICYLKNCFTLEPLTQNGGREGVGLGEEALVSEIQTVMGELRDGLQDLCKSSMAKIFRTVNDATRSPSQLFSGQAAGNRASTDNNQVATQNAASEVPSNPRLNTVNEVTSANFLPQPPLPPIGPQVNQITFGMAYRDLDRKEADDSSRLGYNEQSWSLNWSGTCFSMWHAGKETHLGSTKAGVDLQQLSPSHPLPPDRLYWPPLSQVPLLVRGLGVCDSMSTGLGWHLVVQIHSGSHEKEVRNDSTVLSA